MYTRVYINGTAIPFRNFIEAAKIKMYLNDILLYFTYLIHEQDFYLLLQNTTFDTPIIK